MVYSVGGGHYRRQRALSVLAARRTRGASRKRQSRCRLLPPAKPLPAGSTLEVAERHLVGASERQEGMMPDLFARAGGRGGRRSPSCCFATRTTSCPGHPRAGRPPSRPSRSKGRRGAKIHSFGTICDKHQMRLSGFSSAFKTFQALREAPKVSNVDVGDFRHFAPPALLTKGRRMHLRAILAPAQRGADPVLSVTRRKRSQRTAGGDTRPLAGLAPFRRRPLSARTCPSNTSQTGTRRQRWGASPALPA